MEPIKYRPDIDGLRAVAVLSVVFYHAGIKLFSGGYVGVDVFFVISGYLITSIILREIGVNEFSLARFYEQRIRRIYPALYTVIPFVLLATFLLYDAENFMQASKSAMATTVFSSNILFWTEAGYFDKPSTLKPLLHTWSLAVEEQFYIVFPLLVLLVTRFAKRRLKIALALLAVLSFFFGVYYLQRDPSAAFYFAHLRAWELLIGGLLAGQVIPASINVKFRNILSMAGMTMILASVFLYSHKIPFPGASALLPTLGTALIVYTGVEMRSLIGNFLSLPPLVFIGKISYSLYLWHWPIIIFGKYYAIREATGMDMLVWVLASFAISTLSWRLIEVPFRSQTFLPKPRIFLLAGSIMTLTFLVSGAIYFNDGIPKRFENAQMAALAKSDLQWRRWKACSNEQIKNPEDFFVCDLGTESTDPEFVLWGDSHARALATAVDTSAQKEGVSGRLITLSACPPLLGVDRTDIKFCYQYNESVIQYIETHPELETVILAGRWALSANGERYKTEEESNVELIDVLSSEQSGTNAQIFEIGINRTVERLIELNRNVVIVMPIPEVGYDVPSSYTIAFRTGRDLNEIIAPTFDEYAQRNQIVNSVLFKMMNHYDVLLINPAATLCDQSICKVVVDGRPLYRDGNHLSTFGSLLISSLFDSFFSTMALSQ